MLISHYLQAMAEQSRQAYQVCLFWDIHRICESKD